jgi:hypothetical protein
LERTVIQIDEAIVIGLLVIAAIVGAKRVFSRGRLARQKTFRCAMDLFYYADRIAQSASSMNKVAVWAAAFAFTSPLQAHHSAAMFDLTTPIRVKGVIADVHFANPHSTIFIDVMESGGRRVRWAVENSGTLAMTRQRGLGEDALHAGDPIEVCGFAPKRANPTAEGLAERGPPRRPPWWGSADKVMTGRLLILKSGPAEHWSHYGPLDVCRALLESD